MTPHTQTRAWSYPEDHLFFRASPNARRRPYPRSTSTSVRLRDVEDPVYENASSYTRMKGPSAMEFFRRILPLWKGKEKKDDKDLGKLEKAQDMPYDVLYEVRLTLLLSATADPTQICVFGRSLAIYIHWISSSYRGLHVRCASFS